jgi:hypothetical protein
MARHPTRASDAHQEIAEAIIEPLDVRQHAHGRMVSMTGEGVYSVPTEHSMVHSSFQLGTDLAQHPAQPQRHYDPAGASGEELGTVAS